MFVRRRGVLAPFVVVLMLLGILGQPLLATAQILDPAATETAVPTEVETQPTDVPVETAVPPTDVPATDVPPTEVPATDVPVETAVPPTDVPATEVPPTDVPAEDAPIDAAAINLLTVQVQQCEDTEREFTTDFFFDSEFSAAAVGTNCVNISSIEGGIITVTLVSDTNVYTATVDGSGQALFPNAEYPEIQEGSYNVGVSSGDFSAGTQSQIVLEENGTHNLRIVRYIAGEQTGPTDPEQTADLNGTV